MTNNQYIEIFPNATNDRAPGVDANGVHHFCLTVEKLEPLLDAIAANGGTFAAWTETENGMELLASSEPKIGNGLDGNRQAWLQDPDGDGVGLPAVSGDPPPAVRACLTSRGDPMHRIGILGAAGIAPRALIAPVRRRDDVVIGAVASRRAETAAAYAAEHNIPVAHTGYDALLADPAIDLVYNALPPAGHAEWTIKALAAGKHVLCEKPIAMTAYEARAMVAAAETHGRVLMEAFHDRYHPAFLHLLALRPRLGAVRALRAEFRVDIPSSATPRCRAAAR